MLILFSDFTTGPHSASTLPGPSSTSAVIPQFTGQLAPHQAPLAHLSHLGSPLTVAGLRPQEGAEEAKRRFEIECEFVQALANPNYLNYLAQRGYFKEEYFVNYLKYLLYFKRPEYARTLKFPQCLFFLEALQSSEFREAIASVENARYIEDQQLLQWHFYMRVRQRLQPTANDDDEFAQYMPNKCESCLIFARELDSDVKRLPSKMPKDEAEAWLVDELENICERMLAYRLHKDKGGIARFSKQMTQTAKTIKQLKQKGVEVKLDVSDELLDRPSIESGKLKEHCEWILEHFEQHIEQWFLQRRHTIKLEDSLCLYPSRGLCSVTQRNGDEL